MLFHRPTNHYEYYLYLDRSVFAHCVFDGIYFLDFSPLHVLTYKLHYIFLLGISKKEFYITLLFCVFWNKLLILCDEFLCFCNTWWWLKCGTAETCCGLKSRKYIPSKTQCAKNDLSKYILYIADAHGEWRVVRLRIFLIQECFKCSVKNVMEHSTAEIVRDSQMCTLLCVVGHLYCT
jgi:hypothetical protein